VHLQALELDIAAGVGVSSGREGPPKEPPP